MKKTLLATFASLLVAVCAQANSYFDNNPADVLISQNDPYTGQFTLDGYNPAAETITYAYATFTLFDIGLFDSEQVQVDLSGDILTNGSFFWSLNLGEHVVNALGVLDATGALSYTVSSNSGSFWLDNARLDVRTTTRDGGNSVPDAGATSVLLGLGVIGILGAKRRFASVA